MSTQFIFKMYALILTCSNCFYRATAMLCRARYCYGKSSVCDVEVSWSHRLEFLENNFMAD